MKFKQKNKLWLLITMMMVIFVLPNNVFADHKEKVDDLKVDPDYHYDEMVNNRKTGKNLVFEAIEEADKASILWQNYSACFEHVNNAGDTTQAQLNVENNVGEGGDNCKDEDDLDDIKEKYNRAVSVFDKNRNYLENTFGITMHLWDVTNKTEEEINNTDYTKYADELKYGDKLVEFLKNPMELTVVQTKTYSDNGYLNLNEVNFHINATKDDFVNEKGEEIRATGDLKDFVSYKTVREELPGRNDGKTYQTIEKLVYTGPESKEKAFREKLHELKVAIKEYNSCDDGSKESYNVNCLHGVVEKQELYAIQQDLLKYGIKINIDASSNEDSNEKIDIKTDMIMMFDGVSLNDEEKEYVEQKKEVLGLSKAPNAGEEFVNGGNGNGGKDENGNFTAFTPKNPNLMPSKNYFIVAHEGLLTPSKHVAKQDCKITNDQGLAPTDVGGDPQKGKIPNIILDMINGMLTGFMVLFGDPCQGEGGGINIISQMLKLDSPVNITNNFIIMKIISVTQSLAFVLAIVIIAFYGAMYMTGYENLEPVKFAIRMFFVLLAVYYLPYLTQDILNLNNIIVYYISQIHVTFDGGETSTVVFANAISGMFDSVISSLFKNLLLVVVAIFMIYFAMGPIIKIMTWWYTRLLKIFFYAIIGPIMIVLIALPQTADKGKKWIKDFIGEVFAQVFMVFAIFMVSFILGNMADFAIITNLGWLGAILVIYACILFVAEAPSIASSFIGSAAGMSNSQLAQGAQKMPKAAKQFGRGAVRGAKGTVAGAKGTVAGAKGIYSGAKTGWNVGGRDGEKGATRKTFKDAKGFTGKAGATIGYLAGAGSGFVASITPAAGSKERNQHSGKKDSFKQWFDDKANRTSNKIKSDRDKRKSEKEGNEAKIQENKAKHNADYKARVDDEERNTKGVKPTDEYVKANKEKAKENRNKANDSKNYVEYLKKKNKGESPIDTDGNDTSGKDEGDVNNNSSNTSPDGAGGKKNTNKRHEGTQHKSYKDAKKLVRDKKHASNALLKHEYNLDDKEAQSMMEALEEEGVISKADKDGKRKVNEELPGKKDKGYKQTKELVKRNGQISKQDINDMGITDEDRVEDLLEALQDDKLIGEADKKGVHKKQNYQHEGTKDKKFNDAVNFVKNEKHASASAIAHKVRVSETRAETMLEAMEEKGFVSEMDDGGDRKVNESGIKSRGEEYKEYKVAKQTARKGNATIEGVMESTGVGREKAETMMETMEHKGIVTEANSDGKRDYVPHEGTKDASYEKAVEIVQREGKVAKSQIQNETGIGKARAKKVIEAMEYEDVISEPNDNGKREVYSTEVVEETVGQSANQNARSAQVDSSRSTTRKSRNSGGGKQQTERKIRTEKKPKEVDVNESKGNQNDETEIIYEIDGEDYTQSEVNELENKVGKYGKYAEAHGEKNARAVYMESGSQKNIEAVKAYEKLNKKQIKKQINPVDKEIGQEEKTIEQDDSTDNVSSNDVFDELVNSLRNKEHKFKDFSVKDIQNKLNVKDRNLANRIKQYLDSKNKK